LSELFYFGVLLIIAMLSGRSWSEYCGRTNSMWRSRQTLWHLTNVHSPLFLYCIDL